MKNTSKILFHFTWIWLFLLFVVACSPKQDKIADSSYLEAALRRAGENRTELEKVLRRYRLHPADSLKYRAACFLIENMPSYTYYKGELLDHYLSYFERLQEARRQGMTPQQLLNEIKGRYGEFSLAKLERYCDIETVDSAYLCRNIEWAFKVWREQPWGKNVSFADFCEYILPHRIGGETLADWREEIYRKYNPKLNAFRLDSVSGNEDPAAAARILIDTLRRESRFFTTTGPGDELPHVGPRVALAARSGSCRELSDYVVYVCRALGIPCAVDFLPLHGGGNGGHQWLAFTDKYGALYTSEYPERLKQAGAGNPYKLAKTKVYRTTFGVNRRMQEEMQRLDSVATGIFADPHLLDVTALYTDYYKKEMVVPTDALYPGEPRSRIAYLCASTRMDWEPVAWTVFDRRRMAFPDIQTGNVMRVATYEKGRLRFWTDPFEIRVSNRFSFFTPSDSAERVVLYAKYPLHNDEKFQKRMVGGVFEGSNDPDFRRKEVLHTIAVKPERLRTEVRLAAPSRPYRYVRYMGPKKSHSCVAEVEFYAEAGLLPLRGTPIGTPGCYQKDGSHEYPNVFDGSTETSFDYIEPEGGWAGLDLGTPRRIERIVYTPANRDNYVRPLDDYELFYCAGKRWKSLGEQTAMLDSLVYEGVPKGALLLLMNHSRGNQERIFTYEEGKQVWK